MIQLFGAPFFLPLEIIHCTIWFCLIYLKMNIKGSSYLDIIMKHLLCKSWKLSNLEMTFMLYKNNHKIIKQKTKIASISSLRQDRNVLMPCICWYISWLDFLVAVVSVWLACTADQFWVKMCEVWIGSIFGWVSTRYWMNWLRSLVCIM